MSVRMSKERFLIGTFFSRLESLTTLDKDPPPSANPHHNNLVGYLTSAHERPSIMPRAYVNNANATVF